MSVAHAQQEAIDLESPESRLHLAKLITNLFDRWSLSNADQLALLGLSSNSRAVLSKMRRGTAPLPAGRDILDRASYLLSIHKALRLLYPRNPDDRYNWVNQRNRDFGNQAPLELMRQNMIGVAKVARYLDHLRGV